MSSSSKIILRGMILGFCSIGALGNQSVWGGDPHEHAGDFVVGIDGSNILALEFDFDEQAVLPAVAGLLNGWAFDDPGFLALEKDEPDEGFFSLAPGANVHVEVISISPALQAWTPGFADTLDLPGDLWALGGPGFDEHPTWHINSDSPDFDPQQTKWFFRFRLVDLGVTGYLPSQTYTVAFTNVDPNQPIPTVSEWGLIIMGLLLLTGGVVLFKRNRVPIELA